jgi:hypothetical protein
LDLSLGRAGRAPTDIGFGKNLALAHEPIEMAADVAGFGRVFGQCDGAVERVAGLVPAADLIRVGSISADQIRSG